jgi:hypothetical protein
MDILAEALQHLEAPERSSGPIIDTPIDIFDTAGLISPNPERASLPITITPSEEMVKKSSAWSKEGKREREMSTLILPRPERITMPAAILPTPEELKKLGKKRRGMGKVTAVADLDVGVVKEGFDIVESPSAVDVPDVIGEIVMSQSVPSVIVNALQMESATPQQNQTSTISTTSPSNAPFDSAQLLFQLINLLRDDQALAAFKSVVNNFDSTKIHSTSSIPTQDPPMDPVPVNNDVITHVPVPIGQGSSSVADFIKEPINGVTAVERATASVEGPPPTEEEVILFPAKKTKSTKDKSKDKSDKSKSKKRSKHPSESASHPALKDSAISQASPSDEMIPLSRPATTIDDLSLDAELTRDDLWYNIPEEEDKDELEVGRLSTNGTYTLQDLKSPRHRTPDKVGSYAVPAQSNKCSVVKKTPDVAVGSPVNHTTGAAEEYNRTFRRVDAGENLGIISKPKLVDSVATSPPVLEKPVEIKSAQKVSKTTKDMDETGRQEGRAKIASPAVDSKDKCSTSAATKTPMTPLSKASPIMYDFNPPSPRRVTRRVVLYSKDEATQTSPPPSSALRQPVVESESPTQFPRPAAIHHSRYYNTSPRSAIKSVAKTLTAAEIEALPKGHTGSDKMFMGTLKNVDAGDDLMIVSKPKDTIPIVEETTKVEEEKCGSGIVDVASAVAFIRRKMESDPNGDISALYTLLTSTSGSLAAQNQEAMPEKRQKREKEKREKKGATSRDSPDKPRKDKSNSKKKSTTVPVGQASSPSITAAPAVDKDAAIMFNKPLPVGMGDIFGDLLGEEMPKWDILNPTG